MAKWLPPNGFTGKVHQLDAKVGGTYKMSFTNFTSGKSHSFGGTYLELTPHERIRYTDKFDASNLPGEMQTTITLKQVFCGTELNITQEGVPAAIPPEACYLGWQESLTLLAKLVEAEIPDQPSFIHIVIKQVAAKRDRGKFKLPPSVPRGSYEAPDHQSDCRHV
jgi:uncharacterized protein YndB with AHSA1/START domain